LDHPAPVQAQGAQGRGPLLEGGAPELSFILLNWNTRELFRKSVRAVLDSSAGMSAEHLVIDNGSSDGSADMATAEFPQVTLIRLPKNVGPAAGFNVGMQRARGRLVVLVNTDAFLTRDTLLKLKTFLDTHPEHAIVVPKLLNPDGTTQIGVLRFPALGTFLWHDSILSATWPGNPWRRRYMMKEFDHEESRDVEQPPQAIMMYRREMMEKVGLHDETMPIYFNDVDLCLRVHRQGYKIHYLAEATAVHLCGATSGKLNDRAGIIFCDRIRYARKHFGLLGATFARFALYSSGALEILKCLFDGEASFERRRQEARRIFRLVFKVHRDSRR